MFSFQRTKTSGTTITDTLNDPQSMVQRLIRLGTTATVTERHTIRDQVRGALDAGANDVAIDLSATRFIDSSVLGVLMQLSALATRRGARLRVVGSRPEVRELFQMVRLEHLLEARPA